jgi:hypothetical protein
MIYEVRKGVSVTLVITNETILSLMYCAEEHTILKSTLGIKSNEF